MIEHWLYEESWLPDGKVVDDGWVLFIHHSVKVADNISAALQVTEHRTVQFKPIVMKCSCKGVIQSDPNHCEVILEIHDNCDLIMRKGDIMEMMSATLEQVSAVCDAYYPDNDDEEFGL